MSDSTPESRVVRHSLFENVLEVLPEFVVIHDEERILFANAACRRLLGAVSPDELEGRLLDDFVHPDAREAGRERRRLLFEGGGALMDVPVKLVALDGTTRHLSLDAHPLVFNGFKAALVVARLRPA